MKADQKAPPLPQREDDFPLIVVTIDAATIEEFVADARTAIGRGADLVELRADLLEEIDPFHVGATLPELPIVLTLRRTDDRPEDERLTLLRRLIPYFDYVDLEDDIDEDELVSLVTLAHAERTRTILSWHDHGSTPSTESIVAQLRRLPPGIGTVSVRKVATRTDDAAAVKRLLAAVQELQGQAEAAPLAFMGMGFLGVASRIMAIGRGTALLYATLDVDDSVVVGQPSLESLLQLRGHPIGQDTRLLAVIGYPLSHTLSPPMQNAALRELGIDAVYAALPVPPEAFDETLEGLQTLGAVGCNVTIPLKIRAAIAATQADDRVGLCNAANTLVFRDGGIIAANTDIDGLGSALAAEGFDLEPESVLILGGGGGARGAILALGQGAGSIAVSTRRPSQATYLIEQMQPHVAAELTTVPWSERGPAARECDLLINATPLGMPGIYDDLPMDEEDLAAGTQVFDLVYHPQQTLLVRTATARGLVAADGRSMLLHQGARSLELFLQMEAPLDVMQQALTEGLLQQQLRLQTQAQVQPPEEEVPLA